MEKDRGEGSPVIGLQQGGMRAGEDEGGDGWLKGLGQQPWVALV